MGGAALKPVPGSSRKTHRKATRTQEERRKTMEILTLIIGTAILAALKPTPAQSRRLVVASRLQKTLR
jgi:hypothetical protein